MSLEIGQKIQDDKYSIVRLLGEGGMGAVYEGLNNKIQRKVAIKVLHAAVSENKDAVQRFEREATAAGRIVAEGSDHITEVLDMGELPGGARYMVMEYMDGVSLSSRIEERGRLSPQEAAQIVVQVLNGLSAAHEAKIIHRDMKPDNVFLLRTKAGRKDFVKILDFGISKFNQLSGDANLSMTKTNAVLGTPYYMSPEQAKGSKQVDERCDVYSVGVILYEAVTGQVPFDADTFNELIFKIVLEAPPPPEQFVPDLDPNFAAIIRKAMARETPQRFQNAGEFRDALMQWMETGHIPMFQESATNVGRASMVSVPADLSQFRGNHSAGNPATPAPWTGDTSGTGPAPAAKSNGAIIGIAVAASLAVVALLGVFVVKPMLMPAATPEVAATAPPASVSATPTTPASAVSAAPTTTPVVTAPPVESAVAAGDPADKKAAASPPAGGNHPSGAAGAKNTPTPPAGKQPGGRGVRTTLD